MFHQGHVQHDKTKEGIQCFRLNINDDLKSNDDNNPMRLSGCCLRRQRSLDSSCFPSKNSVPRNERKKGASTMSYDFRPDPPSCSHSGNLKSSHSGNLKSSHSGNLKSNPSHLHSGNVSRRGNALIMYSNSSGMLKPPPIEKKLECTLEELCYGSKKKIMIIRDVLTDTGFVSFLCSFLLYDFHTSM